MLNLFYGDDTYRSREAFRAARARAAGAVITLRDERLTPAAFQAAAEGQSLFGDVPALLVERLTQFTGASATALAEVLRRLAPARSVLVWEEGTPPANGIVWRALQECAQTQERFDLLDEPRVAAWVRTQVQARGRDIEDEACTSLYRTLGADLWRIGSTIDMVLLSTTVPRITERDLQDSLVGQPPIEVFAVVQACLHDTPDRALRAVLQFRQTGEEARNVLFWLVRDLQHLLYVRSLLDRGLRLSVWDLARSRRLPRVAAEQLLSAARHTTMSAARALFERCVVAYYHLNTGRAEAEEILERLILTRSARADARAGM